KAPRDARIGIHFFADIPANTKASTPVFGTVLALKGNRAYLGGTGGHKLVHRENFGVGGADHIVAIDNIQGDKVSATLLHRHVFHRPAQTAEYIDTVGNVVGDIAKHGIAIPFGLANPWIGDHH